MVEEIRPPPSLQLNAKNPACLCFAAGQLALQVQQEHIVMLLAQIVVPVCQAVPLWQTRSQTDQQTHDYCEPVAVFVQVVLLVLLALPV